MAVELHDQPMVYNLSKGRPFVFALDYNQEETRPVDTNAFGAGTPWQVFNFGPNWSCDHLTYLDVQDEDNDPNFFYFNVTQYCPDGGVRNYVWYDWTEPRTLTTLTRLTDGSGTITGFQISYPNGSQELFGLLASVSTIQPETLAILTQVTDPQGHTMKYIYSTNNNQILLTNIVDYDGHINKLVYGNTTYSNAVTQVTNLFNGYSINLHYDTNGLLTNLVDVIGINSSFQYTVVNDIGIDGMTTNSTCVLTRLTTPYGITSFSYFHPTWPLYGDTPANDINRAVTVVEPDNGTNLFMYRDDSSYQPFSSDSRYWNNDTYDKFPLYSNYTDPLSSNNQPYLFYTTYGCDQYLEFRNSFYWGPRQYANLDTQVLTNFTVTDYVLGRMRNWLHSTMTTGNQLVSFTINMEQEPSPDGTNFGQTIWYGYQGKYQPHFEGTIDIPNFIAYQINTFDLSYDNLRTNSAYFDYRGLNTNGFVTEEVIFSDGLNSYLEQTNEYIYETNNIDVLCSIRPDGITNVSFGYDGSHDVLFMTNALGEIASYTYNTDKQVTSITQPNGLITTNIYGSDGFVKQTIVVGYSTNSYAYINGLVYTHTDTRGLTTTNTWDALQRLAKVSYPDGTSISYVYSNLDLVQVVDRLGNMTSYAYDNMRRVVAETNALGNATHYGYCTCGSMENSSDAVGNMTLYNYDLAGRWTNTAYPDGFSVGRQYNFLGQLLAVNDSSGNNINYYYDNTKRLSAVTNTVGLVSASTYDIDNRMTNSTDANNVSVGMTYDNLGRILTRRYPDGGVEGYGYTVNISASTSYTNQIGKVWLYGYDMVNRKTNEVCVGVTTNRFSYDGASDLLTLTDGKNSTNTWIYDEYGRVTSKVDTAGNTNFVYQYDDDNRLTNRWTPARGNTKYRYDTVGNLTNVAYNVSPPITLSYDADNRLNSMVDGIGTTAYSYDQVGQLLSESGLWPSDTVSNIYQNRLRMELSLNHPAGSGWTEDYGYDSARRLTSVESSAGTFNYTYDPVKLQRVDELLLPNNAYITNKYDSVARLLSTALINTGGTNLDSSYYVYNTAGQRTSETNVSGDYRNYTYDNEGELITAKGNEAGGASRSNELFGYAYDAAGNLNFRTNNALIQAFNVNNLNELTTTTNSGTLTVAGTTTIPAMSVTVNGLAASHYADATFALGGFTVTNGINTYTAIGEDGSGNFSTNNVIVNLLATNNYTYDLNGNLISDGTRNFAYDDENELISVCVSNAWSNSFAYDGKLRRRIEQDYTWNSGWIKTNEIHFIYDGNLVVEERNANNNPLVSYSRGNDLSGTPQDAGGIGGMLARTTYGQEIPGAPTTAFYHADGNGSITALMYPSQQLAAKYLYDPYGNALAMSGPLMNFNKYCFSSKEWNSDAGLYYYLYRFYDPNLQKWPSRDIVNELGAQHLIASVNRLFVVQNVNLYCYIENNPISNIDSFGLLGICSCVVLPVSCQNGITTCTLFCVCCDVRIGCNNFSNISSPWVCALSALPQPIIFFTR